MVVLVFVFICCAPICCACSTRPRRHGLTLRMSHEGERSTDARTQDQPERAPPHWLNPLGWAADLFASLSSFNAAARTWSEEVTGMEPDSPRSHTSKKIAQSAWSHLSPCAASRTISESSAILREPSRGASSPEASLRHMATISLPHGERYQGIFANGSRAMFEPQSTSGPLGRTAAVLARHADSASSCRSGSEYLRAALRAVYFRFAHRRKAQRKR